MLPLTAQAHQLIQNVLHPGDWAIDATCGNGGDTLFLARAVGHSGHVYAFDLQSSAIERTRQVIEGAGLRNVTFRCESHALLIQLIPETWKGEVAAVMFNLGYLPGGDRTVITRSESTLPALSAAISLLRPGGILSVIAYPGHPGGQEEQTSVMEWLEGLSPPFVLTHKPPDGISPRSPRLLIVRRQ